MDKNCIKKYLYPEDTNAGPLSGFEDWRLFCLLVQEQEEAKRRRETQTRLLAMVGDGRGFLR